MPSTAIRHYDYRPDRRELEIIFVTGRRYIYSDVPEQTARGLRSATSKGGYFNRRIRDRFPYIELESVDS